MADSSSIEPVTSASDPSLHGPADEYWRLWQQGARPDLNAFIAGAGPLRVEELAGVLRADQRMRWRSGERVPVERYFRDHPEVRMSHESALDLVYHEYLLREKEEGEPDIEGYTARFPELANDLRAQIDLHKAMGVSLSNVALSDEGGELSSNDSPLTTPAIPGFEILGEIGRGGMGVVYKARQDRLKRTVALKMMLMGVHASKEQRARFRREARAAARLQHPHIVQIFEVAEYAAGDIALPYFVMEWVEGASLRATIAGVPQSARWSAELLASLARAVHYAHENGVIHRDLKPANVLLKVDGGVHTAGGRDSRSAHSAGRSVAAKITDFGLAKHLHGELAASVGDAKTESGAILGTPNYMAPEQAAGKQGQVGPAVDIYGLGAILYELLTGRPPFEGDTPLQTLQRVALEEPITPSRLQRKVPRDLETISLKCLEKDPRKRYATALALAEDLDRFLAGETVQARRASRAERTWRWCYRNPWTAGLTGTVLGLLIVLAVGSLIAAVRLKKSADERLWEAKFAEARAYRFRDQIGRRFSALEALAEAARIRPAPELRDEAIAALALMDCRPTTPVQGLTGSTGDFDAEHQLFAGIAPTGQVTVRRVQDGSEVYQLAKSGPDALPALSANGQFLALTDRQDGSTELWRLVGPAPVRIGRYSQSISALSPDSTRAAIARLDGTLTILDLERNRQIAEFQTLTRPVCAAFQPGGNGLAIGSGNTVQILDLATGKIRTTLDSGSRAASLAWHPDGQSVSVSDGVSIQIWDATSRKRMRTLTADRSGGAVFGVSRSGDLLASAGWEGILRIWDTRSGVVLFQTPGGLTSARFGRDDETLAAAYLTGGRLQRWEVSPSPIYRTLVRKPSADNGGYGVVAVSGTGDAKNRLLAACVPDGIALFDLTEGKEIGIVPIGYVRTVLFDETGAMLTNGNAGILRWPIRDQVQASRQLVIGPPEKLPSPTCGEEMACSRDGRAIAIAAPPWGGLILNVDPAKPIVWLTPHEDARYVAVSPDGQFTATGSHSFDSVKVWETSSGRHVGQLPARGVRVRFSGDGRWLYTSGDPGQIWEVGNWERGPQVGRLALGGMPAFSSDGRLLAVDDGAGVIRIVETSTGQEIARLEDPNRDAPFDIQFSPDKRKLVTVSADRSRIHVWDLAAARRELKRIGLSMDPAANPDSPEPIPPGGHLEVQIVLGDPARQATKELEHLNYSISKNPDNPCLRQARAFVHESAGRFAEAVADWDVVVSKHRTALHLQGRGRCNYFARKYSAAVADWEAALALASQLDNFTASIRNNLAWAYANGSAELRAPAKGLPLALQAVSLDPDNSGVLHTLGVIYYRLGQWDKAIATLEHSLKHSPCSANELFFLAMAHHKRGDQAEARRCYAEALAWTKAHDPSLDPHTRDDLTAFRAEAAALGLELK